MYILMATLAQNLVNWIFLTHGEWQILTSNMCIDYGNWKMVFRLLLLYNESHLPTAWAILHPPFIPFCTLTLASTPLPLPTKSLLFHSLFFSTSNGTSSFWAMPWPSAQYHWLHPFNSFIKATSLNSLPKPKTFGAYTCNIPWSFVSPTKKATHFSFHQPFLLHHLLHPQALLLQQDS